MESGTSFNRSTFLAFQIMEGVRGKTEDVSRSFYYPSSQPKVASQNSVKTAIFLHNQLANCQLKVLCQTLHKTDKYLFIAYQPTFLKLKTYFLFVYVNKEYTSYFFGNVIFC